MPRIAGGKDIITQPFYDTQSYPAAGLTNLTFFQTPKGQGATLFAAAGGKNLTDTNMRAAGTFPSPWTFEIFTVQVELISHAATADVDKTLLHENGNLTFNIGSKVWLEIPINHLPGGEGLTGFAGAAATASHTHSGIADPRAVFVMSRSITILENENFDVQMGFPGAPTPTAPVFVRVYLGGELSRSIQ